MKRHFVIEADTEMYSLFVREVKQDFNEVGIEYTCPADTEILILHPPNAEFYGKLDSLLITRGKIERAAPITPVVEDRCTPAQQ